MGRFDLTWYISTHPLDLCNLREELGAKWLGREAFRRPWEQDHLHVSRPVALQKLHVIMAPFTSPSSVSAIVKPNPEKSTPGNRIEMLPITHLEKVA